MSRCTCLVTGANGFIGTALCHALVESGWNVRAAVRHRLKANDTEHIQYVEIGDIGATSAWDEILDGVDVVIHLAARAHVIREKEHDPLTEFRRVNTLATAKLANAAARSGAKRFVYLSSIGVNGNYTLSEPFTENSPPHPHDLYAISKLEAERALQQISGETGLAIVIVRPPLVYGPGNPGNFLRLLKVIKQGIPLPLANVNNRRSMIYLGNLLDAIITCATHPDAAGKTYLVSDGEEISSTHLVHELARLMGKPSRLWPLPAVLLRMAGRLTGKSGELDRLMSSLLIDSSKIRRELSWRPPFSMAQGLEETVQWYQGQSVNG